MKLIPTKDYLLLVDSDAEITRLSYVIGNGVDYTQEAVAEVTQELDSGRVIVNTTTELNKSGLHKIIAYYPLTKEADELDLPLLPNPFKDELKELINKFNANYNRRGEYYLGLVDGAKLGYKAAQSKQFSLKDMKDILEEGLNWFGGGRDKEIRDSETWFNHYIQSLSIQQLPKEFIPEYDLMNEGYNKPEDYPYQECKVLKTITNSEGKQKLVGAYKY